VLGFARQTTTRDAVAAATATPAADLANVSLFRDYARA